MSNSDNHEDQDFIMSEEDKTEGVLDSYEYESDDISNAVDRKPSMVPSIISTVGFLALIILGIAILSRTQDLAEYDQLNALETRLEKLEHIWAGGGDAGSRTPVAFKPEKQYDLLAARLDRLEADFNSKMDQIIKTLESRKERSIPQHAPAAKAPKPEKKEEKAAKPKTHTVQAGETLYRISRRYGVTVDQLREFNNLDPNTKIHPGQEIKLRPQPNAKP